MVIVFRRTEKERFDIERALGPIREAVRRLPKPADYALADEVFDSQIEQLVACIVSIQTEDEGSGTGVPDNAGNDRPTD